MTGIDDGGCRLNIGPSPLVGDGPPPSEGSSLRATMDRCGGLSTRGHPGVCGPPRGQRGAGAAFAWTPCLPRGWINQTVRASLPCTRPAGIVASVRRSVLRRRAPHPRGPAWRRAAPGAPTTGPSPSMSVDIVGGTGMEPCPTYAERHAEPDGSGWPAVVVPSEGTNGNFARCEVAEEAAAVLTTVFPLGGDYLRGPW